MIKKWNKFINEEFDLNNEKLLKFYNDYKNLAKKRKKKSSGDLYGSIGELIDNHSLSYVEVGEVLNTMDTSFDIEGDLQANYDNWIEDGMTKGSGDREDPNSMIDKIYDSIYDMVKNRNEDSLGSWLEELPEGDLDILYKMLVSSGKIENNY